MSEADLAVLVVAPGEMAEMYMYQVDPVEEVGKRGITNAVRVGLMKDGTPVGSVWFSLTSAVKNERATEMTNYLIGSYIRVNGVAVFELPEALALGCVTEVHV